MSGAHARACDAPNTCIPFLSLMIAINFQVVVLAISISNLCALGNGLHLGFSMFMLYPETQVKPVALISCFRYASLLQLENCSNCDYRQCFFVDFAEDFSAYCLIQDK